MTIVATIIGSIPSPSRNAISIGPLDLRLYGLMIALGVIAGVWLLGRQLEQSGLGHARRRQLDRHVGASWPASSAPGSTTWSPTGRASPTTSARSRRSGRAGSASLAGCWPGSPSGPGRPSDAASGPPSCSRSGRRRSPSPRRSGGGATGSTRSCSASRPTCRGRSRSTTSTCPPATRPAPPSTRRSSTSRCGTSPCAAFLLWVQKRFRLAAGRLMGVYLIGYGIGRFWIEGLRIDPVARGRRAALEPVGGAGGDRRRHHLSARHVGQEVGRAAGDGRRIERCRSSTSDDADAVIETDDPESIRPTPIDPAEPSASGGS